MKFEQTLQCMLDFSGDLYPTRKHCLNHLFCTIGNGYEWKNGELVSDDYEGSIDFGIHFQKNTHIYSIILMIYRMTGWKG